VKNLGFLVHVQDSFFPFTTLTSSPLSHSVSAFNAQEVRGHFFGIHGKMLAGLEEFSMTLEGSGGEKGEAKLENLKCSLQMVFAVSHLEWDPVGLEG